MTDATAILAEHGLTGRLVEINASLWQLSGEKGSRGVAVEFSGEPDEGLIREGVKIIAGRLEA